MVDELKPMEITLDGKPLTVYTSTCPHCPPGTQWPTGQPAAICTCPTHIYIPPGQHIHVTCPVHGSIIMQRTCITY